MVPGPVFGVEVRSTSRRARYFAVRAILATALLILLGVQYATLAGQGALDSGTLKGFAQSVFFTVAIAQALAVMAITPALIAPVIAEERNRRTLDYLLTSRLSSGEIVLGKLAARMLHVLGFLAVGLPICSALPMFGGIDPMQVVGAYAVTAACALFVGGLSMLTSIAARGPREAVLTAYGLTAFWLCAAPALEGPILDQWPGLAPILEPVAQAFDSINPFGVAVESWGRFSAILAAAGLAFALIGTIVLRRSARGIGKPRRELAPRRLLPRPPVSDDPMRWKETRTRRASTPIGKVTKGMLLLLLMGLAITTIAAARPAFVETIRFGYGVGGPLDAADEFNGFVRLAGVVLYLLALAATTAAAAGAITSEREADTWTGIVASPMTPSEILRAKRAGVARRVRPLALAALALWLVGAASGAVHPLGFLAAALMLAINLAAARSLGLVVSLASRSTARALIAAILILLVLHGGYLLCCVPITPSSPIVALGCTPVLIYLVPASYSDLGRMPEARGRVGDGVVETILLSLVAYAILAIALNWAAARSFDALEDRPAR